MTIKILWAIIVTTTTIIIIIIIIIIAKVDSIDSVGTK